jgi:hypothetical protein
MPLQLCALCFVLINPIQLTASSDEADALVSTAAPFDRATGAANTTATEAVASALVATTADSCSTASVAIVDARNAMSRAESEMEFGDSNASDDSDDDEYDVYNGGSGRGAGGLNDDSSSDTDVGTSTGSTAKVYCSKPCQCY